MHGVRTHVSQYDEYIGTNRLYYAFFSFKVLNTKVLNYYPCYNIKCMLKIVS